METRQYTALLESLMSSHCGGPVRFVRSVPEAVEQLGLREPDRQKPLKLLPADTSGCELLVEEDIPEDILESRINGLRMRSQMIKAVTRDWADMLDSPEKKLAYLFLSEYAHTRPEMANDEFKADEWAMGELERLGLL
jgi:hypothetical protein